MANRILWPNLQPEQRPAVMEMIGSGFETVFHAAPDQVSDAEWAAADAVVGGCPPQYIDKLKNCRIFVKYGVGYDDVDIERFGKLGIAVCNTPDYGTREVADHAIALMMTLAKSISYHDQELRDNLRRLQWHVEREGDETKYRDLKLRCPFLDELNQAFPNDLRTVTKEVDPVFEITGLAAALGLPVVLVVDVADREGGVAVAVHTADVAGDVEVHDVAIA